MVDINITRAIANLAIFLELSPENVLDEDASIQAMEQLAADLQALDNASRSSLSSNFRVISANYEGEAGNLVKNLPSTFGLE